MGVVFFDGRGQQSEGEQPPGSPAARERQQATEGSAHALTPMPGMIANGTLAIAPIKNDAAAAVAAVAVTSELRALATHAS